MEPDRRLKQILVNFFHLIILLVFIFSFLSSAQKYKFKEIRIDGPEEAIIFSKPVDMESFGPRVFVLDSQECQVRVFSSEGKWLYNLGRYGSGPGEFIGSSDFDVTDDEIALIDSEGQRVNLYGLDGSSRGEFKIGFRGHRIAILSRDKFIVTYMPRLMEKNAFLIHGFNRHGKQLFATEKISSSGQGAFDFLLYQHKLIKLAGQPVLFKNFGPELAFFLNDNGERVKTLKVDPGLPNIEFQPPLPRAKKIRGSFWAVSAFEDKIYLILPGRMEDGDIGPSSRVAVLNSEGKLEDIIDFLVPVVRLTRVANRFFVIDDEANLRLYDLIEGKI